MSNDKGLLHKVIINQKDSSISFSRFIAMCFIVVCHIMQRDGFATVFRGARIEWAFWFNVGVQMFLFISGYLYGKKEKIDTVSFYKKNFAKILVDYYIFVITMIVIIHYSPLLDININGWVIGLLTFSNTVPGMGHLWFVTTILFCYLLTPILTEIINRLDSKKGFWFWISSILILFIIHEIIKRPLGRFTPAYINCFIIGMLYSRIERKPVRHRRLFSSLILCFCLLIIPMQFRIDYWPHADLPPLFASRYYQFTTYGHTFLGISIVLFLRFIWNKAFSGKNNWKILEWSDKYSYDVYLTHHIFIQSSFACVEFIQNRMIALPLAVFLSLVSAIVLYYLSNFVRKLLTIVSSKG